MKNKRRSAEVQKCRSAIFYFCAFVLLFCPLSYAQPPSLPAMPQDIPVEPIKPVMNIEVNNGLLNVEVRDAEFGNVIKEVADKAGFKTDVSITVAYKKISTTFKDLDIERGVRRLLNVIHERDFTISYTTAGGIDKLEIFGTTNTKQTTPTPLKRPQTSKPVMPSQPVQTPIQPIQQMPTTPQPPVMPGKKPFIPEPPPPNTPQPPVMPGKKPFIPEPPPPTTPQPPVMPPPVPSR